MARKSSDAASPTEGRRRGAVRATVERMCGLGVLAPTEGPYGNVPKLRPPICFTKEQADITINAVDRALEEL